MITIIKKVPQKIQAIQWSIKAISHANVIQNFLRELSKKNLHFGKTKNGNLHQ